MALSICSKIKCDATTFTETESKHRHNKLCKCRSISPGMHIAHKDSGRCSIEQKKEGPAHNGTPWMQRDAISLYLQSRSLLFGLGFPCISTFSLWQTYYARAFECPVIRSHIKEAFRLFYFRCIAISSKIMAQKARRRCQIFLFASQFLCALYHIHLVA